MATTSLARRLDPAYGILGAADAWALWDDGSTVTAGRYGAGFYGALVGSTDAEGMNTESQSAVMVPDDPYVADVSIAWVRPEGSEGVRVWTPSTTTVLDYAAPAGWVPDGLAYDDGYLWWIERESKSPADSWNFRLKRARADLTDVTEVVSVAFQPIPTIDIEWDLSGIAWLTPAAMILRDEFRETVNNEITYRGQILLPRGGSAGSTDFDTAIASTYRPQLTGQVFESGALLAFLGPLDRGVFSLPSTVDGDPTQHVDPAWWSGDSESPINASLFSNGGSLAVYTGNGSTAHLHEGPATSPASSPASSVVVEAHPTLGFPNLLWRV